MGCPRRSPKSALREWFKSFFYKDLLLFCPVHPQALPGGAVSLDLGVAPLDESVPNAKMSFSRVAQPGTPRAQVSLPMVRAIQLSTPVPFGTVEKEQAEWLVARAIEEDLPEGDLTCDALFERSGGAATEEGLGDRVRVSFVCREEGVLCGLPVTALIYARIDRDVELVAHKSDGDRVAAAEAFLDVVGRPGSVLRGERIALNFLARLSGIATTTARWLERLRGLETVLLDTRKTTPGWRHLEKYAVRTGGGTNHRNSLSDGYLLKDNHACILRASGRSDVSEWVGRMRGHAPGAFLEIEVDTRAEFLEARNAGVDAILLDNFALEDLRWAVRENESLGKTRPLLEASGGVCLETLRAVAETGVDRISAGSLTHSVRALDMSVERVEL